MKPMADEVYTQVGKKGEKAVKNPIGSPLSKADMQKLLGCGQRKIDEIIAKAKKQQGVTSSQRPVIVEIKGDRYSYELVEPGTTKGKHFVPIFQQS